MELNFEKIVLNSAVDKVGHVINFVILIIKQYLYCCQTQGRKPGPVIQEVCKIEEIEFNVNRLEGKLGKHCAYWKPFQPELAAIITSKGSWLL